MKYVITEAGDIAREWHGEQTTVAFGMWSMRWLTEIIVLRLNKHKAKLEILRHTDDRLYHKAIKEILTTGELAEKEKSSNEA